MIKKKESADFCLSNKAIEEHIAFLKQKYSSIIGKTCQMLSALKFVSMPPSEGLPFLIGIIDDMKKSGKMDSLTEEQRSDLLLDSLDIFLPKILSEKKWVYSIENYILNKFRNLLKTDKRHKETSEPLYFKGTLIERPDISNNPTAEIRTIINDIYKKAKLTERQQAICEWKVLTPYTEDFIAERLKVSRATVTKDYAEAKRKLKPYMNI